MSDSGLAKFQFSDYRINHLSLWCSPKLDLFAPESDKPWDINLSVNPPQFFKDVPMYMGGVRLQLERKMIFHGEAEESAIKIHGSIIGQFPVMGERFPELQEQNLAKTQIPAILFPYLRAAISSMLVNAGFPKLIVPLINLHHVARNSLDKIQIIEISTETAVAKQ